MQSLPEPSPAPWTFAKHIYGLAHCLVDRDGRVIGTNLPIGNGPLLAILRDLVAGVSIDVLRQRARVVLGGIDRGRDREPGEDDD